MAQCVVAFNRDSTWFTVERKKYVSIATIFPSKLDHSHVCLHMGCMASCEGHFSCMGQGSTHLSFLSLETKRLLFFLLLEFLTFLEVGIWKGVGIPSN